MAERDPVGPRSWRDGMLDQTLKAAARVVPPVLAVALFVRSTRSTWADLIVIGSFGVLLIALRAARRMPPSTQALVAISWGFATCVYIVARAGLGAGVSVGFATMCTLAVVYLGRWFGYLLAALSGAAAILVGLMVTRGTLTIATAELNPLLMTNWVRIGVTSGLLSALLVTVIDLVIRRVEAGAQVTNAALDELRLAYGQLRQLHDKLESAKEEERKFIAHELHDELGQNLTILKLQLVQTARKSDLPPGDKGNAEVFALIDQLITRVRKMSGDLRPDLLDEVGLIPALRAYLHKQTTLSGVAIDQDLAEPERAPRLAPDLEIACFRIVQEALTNALRHASPDRIEVRVQRDQQRIAITVHDEGPGFDTDTTLAAAASSGHLGVVGMRERVRAHGGAFQVRSAPGQGTTVEAVLPAQ